MVHNIKSAKCYHSYLDVELNSEPANKQISVPSHLDTAVLTRGWVGASPLARSRFATCRTPTLRATVWEETASAAPFGTPGFLGRG